MSSVNVRVVPEAGHAGRPGWDYKTASVVPPAIDRQRGPAGGKTEPISNRKDRAMRNRKRARVALVPRIVVGAAVIVGAVALIAGQVRSQDKVTGEPKEGQTPKEK